MLGQSKTLSRLDRQMSLLLQGGFHGRTFGAMALTTSKTVYRQGFAPLMPGVSRLKQSGGHPRTCMNMQ